jgi:calcium-dependent protein kinase
MWNQHECANLALVFQYYKGEKATFERIFIENSDIKAGIEGNIKRIAASDYPQRWNIQIITPVDSAFPIISNSGVLEYFEALPLDISTLGHYSQRLAAAFTNPRARAFHTQRLGSFTVPFNCFFEQFKPLIHDAGITISIGLRRAIQSYVDLAGTASIMPEDVDRFFNLWENQQSQHEILSLAQRLDQEARSTGDTIGYKLFLVVVRAEIDPITSVQSFEKGDVFVITHEGCPQSSRFAADRVTYAGKEGPLQTNDIVFKEAETRIRSHHFSILSRRSGFYVVDGGSLEGVRLLIEDFPVVLFTNAMLYFGQSKCVVCSTTARQPAPLSEFIHILDYSQTEESLPASTPELELAFLSGPLFGRTFRLSPDTKEVYTLGSSPEADISLRDLGSSVHAWILHGDYGWAVVDMQSQDGTWIAVNMHDRETAERSSPPLRIRNGMVMEVPGTRFKCVFKSDITFKVQISDFVEVRNIDFRSVYEVGGKVGAGAYGQVFQCRHRGTSCMYAVKIISKSRVDNATLFEIVTLKRLDHPNIIRVLDIVDDGRSLYIVTELLSGGELFTKIVERGHLSEANAAEVMQQLLAAVSFIHSRSVLHRDIKPENLMYESPLEGSALKLIDFGAARILLPAYKTAERVGTPYYMAPEVIQGKYDSKCDVWSCGVVLYILLSGRPPFRGRSEYEIFAHIQTGSPSFAESTWKHVSKPAKSLIKDMLKIDPKERPTAYEVLHHPWILRKYPNVDYTKPLAEKAFACLKSFNASNKLQQAILIFIANNLLSAEERNYAMQLFRSMDKDGSGLISKEELHEGFRLANFEITEEKMEGIMKELDANMSGMIDYSEFLTGVTAMESLLSRDRLNLMFAMFDADGSGDISASELKAILGQSESRWAGLIDQVDNNKDGKIDIFEFKSLMLSYIS